MKFLKNFTRRLRGAEQINTQAIGGFREICPIGNSRGELITNKAGRGVFKAKSDGRVVKLYEAYSPEHAVFIQSASGLLPDILPSVIAVQGNWVIAEWVEGKPIIDNVEERQASVLRRIHGLNFESLPSPGFDYWHDYLVPRFRRASALMNRCRTSERIIDFVNMESATQTILQHPDVSPANLVERQDGNIICVDNELLCVGRRPLLDLCNAARPLGRERRELLASLWLSNAQPSIEALSAVALAWIVREVGSAFLVGRLETCEKLLNMAETNPMEVLPFSARTFAKD